MAGRMKQLRAGQPGLEIITGAAPLQEPGDAPGLGDGSLRLKLLLTTPQC